MLRKLGAVALAVSMFAATTGVALADANQAALAPGKAATVKEAQEYFTKKHVWYLVGGGIVIGGIILLASGNGHGTVGTTTTCPLSGCSPTTTTTSTTH